MRIEDCDFSGVSTLACSDVVMGDDGLPTGWKILESGTIPLTLNGVRKNLILGDSDLEAIAGYHAEKKVQIPIDSEHFLSYMADENKVSESEALKMFPEKIAAIGTGDVVKEGSDLWMRNVQYSEAAKPFIKAAVKPYFSPYFRGLDGKSPLRITAMSFVSNPAINGVCKLAASGEFSEPITPTNPSTQGAQMNELEKMISEIFGISADELTTPEGLKKVKDAIMAKKEECAELPASGEVMTRIEAIEKRQSELAASGEALQRDTIIATLKSEGKLTEAQTEWARSQSVLALSEFAKVAPKVVPVGSAGTPADKTEKLALSAEEKEICEMTGVSEEEFLAAKTQKR